jgi:hypothetical protein
MVGSAHDLAVKRILPRFLRREGHGFRASGSESCFRNAEITGTDTVHAAASDELQFNGLAGMNGYL